MKFPKDDNKVISFTKYLPEELLLILFGLVYNKEIFSNGWGNSSLPDELKMAETLAYIGLIHKEYPVEITKMKQISDGIMFNEYYQVFHSDFYDLIKAIKPSEQSEDYERHKKMFKDGNENNEYKSFFKIDKKYTDNGYLISIVPFSDEIQISKLKPEFSIKDVEEYQATGCDSRHLYDKRPYKEPYKSILLSKKQGINKIYPVIRRLYSGTVSTEDVFLLTSSAYCPLPKFVGKKIAISVEDFFKKSDKFQEDAYSIRQFIIKLFDCVEFALHIKSNELEKDIRKYLDAFNKNELSFKHTSCLPAVLANRLNRRYSGYRLSYERHKEIFSEYLLKQYKKYGNKFTVNEFDLLSDANPDEFLLLHILFDFIQRGHISTYSYWSTYEDTHIDITISDAFLSTFSPSQSSKETIVLHTGNGLYSELQPEHIYKIKKKIKGTLTGRYKLLVYLTKHNDAQMNDLIEIFDTKNTADIQKQINGINDLFKKHLERDDNLIVSLGTGGYAIASKLTLTHQE